MKPKIPGNKGEPLLSRWESFLLKRSERDSSAVYRRITPKETHEERVALALGLLGAVITVATEGEQEIISRTTQTTKAIREFIHHRLAAPAVGSTTVELAASAAPRELLTASSVIPLPLSYETVVEQAAPMTKQAAKFCVTQQV